MAIAYVLYMYRTGFMETRDRNFIPFCSFHPDLDPMTFICELDPCYLEIYRMCKYGLLRQGFRKLLFYRQTDRQTRPKLYTHHVASRVHAPKRRQEIRMYDNTSLHSNQPKFWAGPPYYLTTIGLLSCTAAKSVHCLTTHIHCTLGSL